MFKDGDKLKCIRPNGCNFLTLNKEYKATKDEYRMYCDNFVEIKDDNGIYGGYLASRFELAQKNIQFKNLYIVYVKDSFGLCAVDLFVADSEQQAIKNFKEEHPDYANDFILDIKIVDKCDNYKICVGGDTN